MAEQTKDKPKTKPKTKTSPAAFSGEVTITVPVAKTGDYISTRNRNRIDLRFTAQQARGFDILMEGLVTTGGADSAGNRVRNHPDAIRWVLEQIAAAAEKL